MFASELIEKLQRTIDVHGDQPVRCMDDTGHFDVVSLAIYDAAGNAPDKDGKLEKPVEIILR
jgi:hypothetical protein